MACILTKGRNLQCKDSLGGLLAVYFVDFGDLGNVTITDDEITDMDGTFSAYKYEIKGTSSFEQTIISTREAGTTSFDQTLTLMFNKLTKEDHKEIKLLAYGRPHIVVEDRNGNAFLMGLVEGAEVTGGSIVTGAGIQDKSGYEITFLAQEGLPANFINGALKGDPFAGMTSATDTVVEGA